MRKIYNKVLRKFIKKTFSFWQMFGFHITPNHFYEPIPDTKKLKNNLWQGYSNLIGIDMNGKKQLKLLSYFVSNFKKEYESFLKEKTSIPYKYYVNNRSFASTDGEVLYCMIRFLKPKKVVEIGSGFSTYLLTEAILKNKKENNINTELIIIDPYPSKVLEKGLPEFSKLIKKEVQDVSLSFFHKLKENDILFIDSSHTLKIGSDVQYEYLEILPSLNVGVIIHIHDIFLPLEYPKEWILKYHRFWTEQYLLQAFLIFNNVFEVLWGGSYMHLKHSKLLKSVFSSYNPKTIIPGSFWMRKKI